MPESFIVLDVPLQVHETQTRLAFIEEVAKFEPALIIIDTLARCAVGLDENSTRDMGQFVDAVGELARKSRAHVMIVHHNNRLNEFRGSSALPAGVDTHLSLERSHNSVTLKTEKQKDGDELPPLLFESVPVEIRGANGTKQSLVFRRLETTSSQEGLTDLEQMALDVLLDCYGSDLVTSSQWKMACKDQKGMAESSFSKAVAGLLKKGKVAIVAGKKGGKGKDAAQYQVSSASAPQGETGEDAGPEAEETAEE